MAIALGAGRVLLRKNGVDDRNQISLTDAESSTAHWTTGTDAGKPRRSVGFKM